MILQGPSRSLEMAFLWGGLALVWGRTTGLMLWQQPLATLPMQLGLMGVTLGFLLAAFQAVRPLQSRVLSDRLVYDIHKARREIQFSQIRSVEVKGQQLWLHLHSGRPLLVAQGTQVQSWARELEQRCQGPQSGS